MKRKGDSQGARASLTLTQSDGSNLVGQRQLKLPHQVIDATDPRPEYNLIQPQSLRHQRNYTLAKELVEYTNFTVSQKPVKARSRPRSKGGMAILGNVKFYRKRIPAKAKATVQVDSIMDAKHHSQTMYDLGQSPFKAVNLDQDLSKAMSATGTFEQDKDTMKYLGLFHDNDRSVQQLRGKNLADVQTSKRSLSPILQPKGKDLTKNNSDRRGSLNEIPSDQSAQKAEMMTSQVINMRKRKLKRLQTQKMEAQHNLFDTRSNPKFKNYGEEASGRAFMLRIGNDGVNRREAQMIDIHNNLQKGAEPYVPETHATQLNIITTDEQSVKPPYHRSNSSVNSKQLKQLKMMGIRPLSHAKKRQLRNGDIFSDKQHLILSSEHRTRATGYQSSSGIPGSATAVSGQYRSSKTKESPEHEQNNFLDSSQNVLSQVASSNVIAKQKSRLIPSSTGDYDQKRTMRPFSGTVAARGRLRESPTFTSNLIQMQKQEEEQNLVGGAVHQRTHSGVQSQDNTRNTAGYFKVRAQQVYEQVRVEENSSKVRESDPFPQTCPESDGGTDDYMDQSRVSQQNPNLVLTRVSQITSAEQPSKLNKTSVSDAMGMISVGQSKLFLKRTPNLYLEEYELLREPITFSLNQVSARDHKILLSPEKNLSKAVPKVSEEDFYPISNLSIYMSITQLPAAVKTLFEQSKVSPLLCVPMEALRAANERRCSSYLQNFMIAMDKAQLMRAQTLLIKGLKLKVNPVRVAFKTNLGVVYCLQQRYTESVAVFKRLLGKNPTSLSLIVNYFFALFCAGWQKEIAAEIKKSQELRDILKEFIDKARKGENLESFKSPQHVSFCQIVSQVVTDGVGLKGDEDTYFPHQEFKRLIREPAKRISLGLYDKPLQFLADHTPRLQSRSRSSFLGCKVPKGSCALPHDKEGTCVQLPAQHLKYHPVIMKEGDSCAIHIERAMRGRQQMKSSSPPRVRPLHQTTHYDIDEPNDWDFFQAKMAEYDEYKAQLREKATRVFEDEMRRVRSLCPDTAELTKAVATQVIKDTGKVYRSDDSPDKVYDLDILRVHKNIPDNIEEELLGKKTGDEMSKADQQLSSVFVKLMQLHNVNKTSVDTLQDSFFELIEGVRVFDERFGIRRFVEAWQQISNSDFVGMAALYENYNTPDPNITRARTFILATVGGRGQSEIQMVLNELEALADEAEQQKLQKQLAPEAFDIDLAYAQLVNGLLRAMRSQKAKLDRSVSKTSMAASNAASKQISKQISIELESEAQKSFTKNFRQDVLSAVRNSQIMSDEDVIARLSHYREFAGDGTTAQLCRVCDISVAQFHERLELAAIMNTPAMYNKLLPTRVLPDERVQAIDTMVEHARAANARKPFTDAQLAKIEANVNLTIAQCEKEGRKRYQKRLNEEANKFEFDSESEGGAAVRKQRKETEEDRESSSESEESEHVASQAEECPWNPDFMVIEGINSKPKMIWEEAPEMAKLKDIIAQMWEVVADVHVVLDKDRAEIEPIMEKWGKATRSVVASPRSGGSVTSRAQMAAENTQINIKRMPIVGKEFTPANINFVKANLHKASHLDQEMIERLDQILAETNSFFALFDHEVRVNLYKRSKLMTFFGKGVVVEPDQEKSDSVYIILQGNVEAIRFKAAINENLNFGFYGPGQVFGDSAIQRDVADPMAEFSDDVTAMKTGSDYCLLIKIRRDEYLEALFHEMNHELFYKIDLLKKTSFFNELSPYALLVIASNVEVRSYQYGQEIITQDCLRDECFIMAHGRAKATYAFPVQVNSRVNDFAKKCLRVDRKPKSMLFGPKDFKNLAPLEVIQHKKDMEKLEIARKKQQQKEESMNTQKFQDGNDEKKPNRFRFKHTIIDKNKSNHRITYVENFTFEDYVTGDAVATRTLLDRAVVRKYITENLDDFCLQCNTNLNKVCAENKKKLETKLKAKQDRAIELKFQQDHPDFGSNTASAVSILEPNMQQVSEIDLSYHNDNSLIVLPPEDRPPKIDLAKGKDMTMKGNKEKPELKNPQEYIQMFIDKGDKIKEETQKRQKGDRIPQKKRYTLDERVEKLSEDVKNQMLIDKLYDKLMRSQVSIVVTTESAKVLVLKRTDKNFLDESIKTQIDSKLLEGEFKDYDRPLGNEETLWSMVENREDWTKQKQTLQHEIMREQNMNRRFNKLVDN